MTAAHRAGRADDSIVPELVLFDCDGTLIHDLPYNRNPDRVTPVPGAAAALRRLRAAGALTGVVTNQSGVGRGLISRAELAAVRARVVQLLGPFDVWRYCPHHPDDGCACRKPAPGMIFSACAEVRVDPRRCVVVGDRWTDAQAARAAGAGAILLTGSEPLATGADGAAAVGGDGVRTCADLPGAVDLLLGGGW